MSDKTSPNRLKAAELILARGHGAAVAGEQLAMNEIIEEFQIGNISAIEACLMLESEGVKVPEIMQGYFRNELAIANFLPFNEQMSVGIHEPPVKIPRS